MFFVNPVSFAHSHSPLPFLVDVRRRLGGSLVALLLLLKVIVEVAVVVSQLFLADFDHVRGHGVHEVAVVAHDDGAAL